MFRDLPEMLNEGDVLVLNESRVIPARLFGQRTQQQLYPETIEVLLTEQLSQWEWRTLGAACAQATGG